jgi:hypothetical protein
VLFGKTLAVATFAASRGEAPCDFRRRIVPTHYGCIGGVGTVSPARSTAARPRGVFVTYTSPWVTQWSRPARASDASGAKRGESRGSGSALRGNVRAKIPNSAEFLGFDSIPVQPWSAEPSVVRSDFSWMQSILECQDTTIIIFKELNRSSEAQLCFHATGNSDSGPSTYRLVPSRRSQTHARLIGKCTRVPLPAAETPRSVA